MTIISSPPTGTGYGIGAHIDDHDHRIALGLSADVGKYEDVHKFGYNAAVSTTEESIWLPGGSFELPGAAGELWIACEDNTNGVGQVIQVTGVNAEFDFERVNVTLAGNTPVEVVSETGGWWLVNRAYQISAKPDPVGDVWFGKDDADFTLGIPQTASNIMGKIDYTNAAQQTQQAMLMVPRGFTGVINRFEGYMGDVSSGAARSAEINLEIEELAYDATISSPAWTPRRSVATIVVSNSTVTAVEDFEHAPLVVKPLSLISARGTATASSALYASFDVTLYPGDFIGTT